MTIRGKLVAAIALTVIGPVVTIAVALAAFGSLGDHSDDVRRAGERQALALELAVKLVRLDDARRRGGA